MFESGRNVKNLFGGLLFTSHCLNLQHWISIYITVYGNFQGIYFDFPGLFFAFLGGEIAQSPRLLPWFEWLLICFLHYFFLFLSADASGVQEEDVEGDTGSSSSDSDSDVEDSPARQAARSRARTLSTPAVKRLAMEHNVSILSLSLKNTMHHAVPQGTVVPWGTALCSAILCPPNVQP